MKAYNWQQPDWPNFKYDVNDFQEILFKIAEKAGLIGGKLAHLDAHDQSEAMIMMMVEEAVKSSEIEGEYLSREDLRSSIKNNLGLNTSHVPVEDQRAQGMANLLLDVRQTFKQNLTKKQLFSWHKMLMTGYQNSRVRIGVWRSGPLPMQIISGYHGKYKIHFEAPPSERVDREMKLFLDWFNQTSPGHSKVILTAPIRAAIAHLYFESIHPFDDGNGRIGRAIAEKALFQGVGYPMVLSLSLAIEENKRAYYDALKSASSKNDVTEWLHYFLDLIFKAQLKVEQNIQFFIQKTKFFDDYESLLNDRHLKVIKRIMREGIKGFEGGLTAKKYMAITDVSKATATRDLQYLTEIGALVEIGRGRSVRYALNLES